MLIVVPSARIRAGANGSVFCVYGSPAAFRRLFIHCEWEQIHRGGIRGWYCRIYGI